ncbi:hypothetical protein NDU88_000896 [Pleurodeles waltl]|uniref:Uncharacterized protein n=1 Tax=Pleurodeles waltl TaxID=8319 RepID=A0AAV7N9A7_PLEWA|nr:hypothetical protein NDU88_000896 [Pleurodeles waltl]
MYSCRDVDTVSPKTSSHAGEKESASQQLAQGSTRFLDQVLRVSLPCVLEFLHGTRCKNNGEKRLGQCRWRSFL